jgi:hypothetical protein
MREKFNPFIKFCATRTVPSTGTKSMGLAADAHGVLVFAVPISIGIAKTTPPRSAIRQMAEERQLTKPQGR